MARNETTVSGVSSERGGATRPDQESSEKLSAEEATALLEAHLSSGAEEAFVLNDDVQGDWRLGADLGVVGVDIEIGGTVSGDLDLAGAVLAGLTIGGRLANLYIHEGASVGSLLIDRDGRVEGDVDIWDHAELSELHVQGTIDGDLTILETGTVAGRLILGEQGRIEGDLECAAASIIGGLSMAGFVGGERDDLADD